MGEFSTLGGWIATRSAGQNSNRYGKIEDMAAGRAHGESPDGLEPPTMFVGERVVSAKN